MATITGTSGNDLLNGTWSDDTLDGGDAQSGAIGNNRADYSNNTSAQPINVNLGTGTASDGLGGTDTLISRKKTGFALPRNYFR